MPFDGTTKTSPVLATLLAGRRLIEQGWIQGAVRTHDGVCLMGSLAIATTPSVHTHARALLKQAILANGYRFDCIAHFNDAPGRTQAEVLAVYDEAIRLALVG